MMEKDYYVYSAEILLAGTRAFLEEKLPAPPTPGHMIGLLSAPLHVLLPMLQKSEKASPVLEPLLEDYTSLASRELLQEIKIMACHLLSQNLEGQKEQELKRAQAEAGQLIRHYGANALPDNFLYPPLRKHLLPAILIDKLRYKW
ncbi:hypothetical protein Q0590_35495 [Rhodocytophaga aerolata]|uniref:Uncharacterized protein n=1 Tax=Rhodocytophaga aerolata TaxID=455078 RepID=A0ABT8RKX2_9BACT|nr:hypothetical protein [Rhodocytophaga aerolata]MDO1451632.1 hypothetical protein [Rhodocytophaga aerolata]